MAPFDFDAPDTDTILRSSDGKEFRVHKVILSLASPVFQGMFGLPQPPEPPSQIPTIDVPESSDILAPFLQLLYPRSPPKVQDIATWATLYATAEKYSAEMVMETLRDMLIPRFLDTSPVRVYALASHWGFEEEAKIASRRILTIDILKDFPQDDAELMGGVACQKLYHLHVTRCEAAQALIINHPLPSSSDLSCCCDPPDYSNLISDLCKRVARRPWLTAEELYDSVYEYNYPKKCSNDCRDSNKNVHAYLSSLLKGISELPQTI